ncbi:MAG TPA: alpha-ketoglutarate-dependent dioxygenase AlkB, partial [Polyangia bacterium]|nr:alpha-ketoglutarate-dependent dioxygenase AlkB [Polyangia bacterium]
TGLDQTAWVERAAPWVSGHESLMQHLTRTTQWQRLRREMYDRTVDVPRLIATLPEDGPGHPLLEEMRAFLSARYHVPFQHVTLALYRDGNDSVAWHGDTVARALPEAMVATVSLGAPRRFLLRPRGGGRAVAFSLGWGDLMVMGGSCQRTWQHAVPKVAHADPRLAVMFRPPWYRPPPARRTPA